MIPAFGGTWKKIEGEPRMRGDDPYEYPFIYIDP